LHTKTYHIDIPKEKKMCSATLETFQKKKKKPTAPASSSFLAIAHCLGTSPTQKGGAIENVRPRNDVSSRGAFGA
jgi:hypothetical protein